MRKHDAHTSAAGLFVPDTLLATQYFDRVRRRKDVTGEQRLMFAVLADAVDLYLKHAGATAPHHAALFADAERWIEDDDTTWLYAFVPICDHFGLDPDAVRGGLRAWKRRVRGEPALAAPAPAVDEAVPRRRASNE